MLAIDGSYLEGGGQILRTAISLSAVLKIPCRIFNIRKNRPEPGLKTQHLIAIQAVSRLCGGNLEGDYLGSEEIKFWPGEIVSRDLHIKIETAGSIVLCLQSLLPVALFTKEPIKIIFDGGGTDVPFSPTLDYFRFVFLKILEKMGPKIELKILKRGFYPAGGAKVEVKVFPIKVQSLNLTEKGQIKKIIVYSVASEGLKEKKVAERQKRAAEEIIDKLNLPFESKIEYVKTDSPGGAICLLAQYENTILGADVLAKPAKRSEEVGKEGIIFLLEEEKSQGCLDRFLADQVLIYLALSGKKSSIKVSHITNHSKTNIWVIEHFLSGKFEIKNNIISWVPS